MKSFSEYTHLCNLQFYLISENVFTYEVMDLCMICPGNPDYIASTSLTNVHRINTQDNLQADHCDRFQKITPLVPFMHFFFT